MKLNYHALEELALWWVEVCPVPKMVPVDVMRDEARQGNSLGAQSVLAS